MKILSNVCMCLAGPEKLVLNCRTFWSFIEMLSRPFAVGVAFLDYNLVLQLVTRSLPFLLQDYFMFRDGDVLGVYQ